MILELQPFELKPVPPVVFALSGFCIKFVCRQVRHAVMMRRLQVAVHCEAVYFLELKVS